MKISVLVPHHGPVKALFAQCLANLMAETAQAMVRDHLSLVRPQIRAFFEEDGSIELKRVRLALTARKWGADYVLFADSDHTFPPDALLRLLAHERPVVGCNYVSRNGALPAAVDGSNNKLPTTEAKADAGLVEEVAALGLGFCLIHTHVFERLGDQIPFVTRINAAGEVLCGEDVHFFNLVRAAGVGVFLDHKLSWDIGHIAETIRTNREAGNAALA
ncbi:MAG: hypothetical protein QOJ27_2609 [Sphingomonadales bacterium]|nr:hypothetical protein [Sphingomonadales bacterium]